MTIQDITEFFENKICNIVDENIREELLDQLHEVDIEIRSLENSINDELEYQYNHIEDVPYGYDYDLYLRSVRE